MNHGVYEDESWCTISPSEILYDPMTFPQVTVGKNGNETEKLLKIVNCNILQLIREFSDLKRLNEVLIEHIRSQQITTKLPPNDSAAEVLESPVWCNTMPRETTLCQNTVIIRGMRSEIEKTYYTSTHLTIRLYPGIHGPNELICNGIYDPVPDEFCDSVSVYLKRGDSGKWIEYNRQLGKWIIRPVNQRGTNKGWAYISCESPVPLENCNGAWSVYNKEGRWTEQKSASWSVLR